MRGPHLFGVDPQRLPLAESRRCTLCLAVGREDRQKDLAHAAVGDGDPQEQGQGGHQVGLGNYLRLALAGTDHKPQVKHQKQESHLTREPRAWSLAFFSICGLRVCALYALKSEEDREDVVEISINSHPPLKKHLVMPS